MSGLFLETFLLCCKRFCSSQYASEVLEPTIGVQSNNGLAKADFGYRGHSVPKIILCNVVVLTAIVLT